RQGLRAWGDRYRSISAFARPSPGVGLEPDRIGRIDKHGNTRGYGQQLAQQAQPLCRQLSREKIDAGRVAARSGEAGDKTELDRVVADAEDDRDRRRCRSGGEYRRRGTGRDDYRDPATDQIGRQLWKLIVAAFRRADLDGSGLSQNVTDF